MLDHRIRLNKEELTLLVEVLEEARKNHRDLPTWGRLTDLWYRLRIVGGARRNKTVWPS